jgi:hypothetical protein
MYPHRIRLRGPWICQASGRGKLPAVRVTMPDGWSQSGLTDFRGELRCTRHFGYPGRIDAGERVWLTVEGVSVPATLTLNGRCLGICEKTAEFDVTSLLQPRNTLEMIVDVSPGVTQPWEEVALEIRATAFLQHVEFQVAGEAPAQLRARGLVIGSAERPLDLYLLAGASCLAQCTVETAATGRPFVLSATLPDSNREPALPVRIELVDAATIWYVVEGRVEIPQSRTPAHSSKK